MSLIKYRPDIDGMRAIAVGSVIIYHLNSSFLPGGFLGVDIFFVISGFLISSIIIKEISLGSFSLINFYERRARRLIPTLTFMMLFCTIAALILLSPKELKDFGQSLFAEKIIQMHPDE